MKYELTGKRIGMITGELKAPVKTWRKAPGVFDNAARAALYYARRYKKRYLVVPCYNYMQITFHIVLPEADIMRFCPGIGDQSMKISTVDPDGTVLEAMARKGKP